MKRRAVRWVGRDRAEDMQRGWLLGAIVGFGAYLIAPAVFDAELVGWVAGFAGSYALFREQYWQGRVDERRAIELFEDLFADDHRSQR